MQIPFMQIPMDIYSYRFIARLVCVCVKGDRERERGRERQRDLRICIPSGVFRNHLLVVLHLVSASGLIHPNSITI